MPIQRKGYHDLIARGEAEHRAARSETLRDLVKTCGHMLFWLLAGWSFLGLSAHTTNVARGWILFWVGVTVWIPGILFSLLAAYRRGEKRGDW